MKKRYIFILLLAVGTSLATAQNKDTKRADDLYNRLVYTDAAAAYQKLLKDDKGSRYVFERLANSYYFINDTKKAETYYRRVVRARTANPETVYNYAQSLKANGKFAEHNTWMKTFAEMKPNDSRAQEFLKNPNYIPTIMDAVPRFSATNLEEINTEYSEFGGITLGKTFYFSSARNTQRRNYGWNEEPYLDVYEASIVGGTVKDAVLMEGDVNTKFHEGNVAISPNGKRIYFDRNDYYRRKYDKSEEGINQINLYYAELVDGEWQDVQLMPFNSSEYSTGHPALSPDGSTLYFVSDKPGGKGSSDIYKVSVNPDGGFGSPEIVGGGVNTEGKEVFPFVDSAGTLYFSSDGHLGIGLLDVFAFEDGTIKNLGVGVNSADDDFAFKYDPVTEGGYVSSNREGGKGSDDIYAIQKIEPPCEVTINVKVINEYTDEPIFGARVDMYDLIQNKLSTRSTSEIGMSALLAECEKPHVLQGFKEGFEPNAVDVSAAPTGEVSAIIELRPIEAIIVDDKVVLNPILFDYDKHNIKPQAAFELDKLVAIMKKYPNMVIAVESHTDFRGNNDYNLSLSERRAQSTVQYVISQGIDVSRISGKGFGETDPEINCGTNCTEEEHQTNRRSEFIILER